jgi:hypothetical protein
MPKRRRQPKLRSGSEDRAWADYSQAFREKLMPQLLSSAVCIAMYDAEGDDAEIRFATQLGIMLLYDKPIILTHPAGLELPERLRRIADEVVELDLGDPACQDALVGALRRLGAETDLP